MVRITALMDNLPSEHKALVNEHGLSYLLEMPGLRLLFDCGATGHPLDNARRLGLSVADLDAVALSHSHYDHAAGYRDLIEQGLGSSILYTGPHFFEKKFAYDGLIHTDLSAGFDETFLKAHGITRKVVQGLEQIAPGVYLVSGFPRVTPFEQIPERFVRLTETGFIPDDFADEQCLVLDRGGKLYVFVGCSHPGILNMTVHIHNLLGKPIAAVYGGTHLVEADGKRIEKTVAVLKDMGLQTLGFSHCSGSLAEEQARQEPGLGVCHLACGRSVILE